MCREEKMGINMELTDNFQPDELAEFGGDILADVWGVMNMGDPANSNAFKGELEPDLIQDLNENIQPLVPS